MTKKDYEMIAHAVNKTVKMTDDIDQYKASFIVKSILKELESGLSIDNPRFDPERFRKACGI